MSIFAEMRTLPSFIAELQDTPFRLLRQRILGAGERPTKELDLLRVAALASSAELFAEVDVQAAMRPQRMSESSPLYVGAWQAWHAFAVAARGAGRGLSAVEGVFVAASAHLASEVAQARSLLRALENPANSDGMQRLDDLVAMLSHCICYLSALPVREDIENASRLLDRAAREQRAWVGEWITSERPAVRASSQALAVATVGEAIAMALSMIAPHTNIRSTTARSGRVQLETLLARADAVALASGDAATLSWVRAAAASISGSLRSSILENASNTSPLIDKLLEHLTSTAATDPIYSLLPSQRQALERSVLDPTKTAIVLQMPTSAGKTLVAELAILSAFSSRPDSGSARALYIVPTRALASQTRRTLRRHLSPVGIDVLALGGAFEEDPYEDALLVAKRCVLVATPEKVDLVLRSHPETFANTTLIVVDEAHLIAEGARGARLELLLANIRREFPEQKLLLLSPFVSNAEVIAGWLGANRGAEIRIDWRPLPVIVGEARYRTTSRGRREISLYAESPFGGQADASTHFILAEGVASSSLATKRAKCARLARDLHPAGTVLVLHSTSRTEPERLVEDLIPHFAPISPSNTSDTMRVAIGVAKAEFGANSLLARALERGLSFHHSAVPPLLRLLIEELVREEQIAVLAATTTLAQGMNFPVSSLVIHSVFKPYGQPLSAAEFWNIAGRAGRVGLSDVGLVLFADEADGEHRRRYVSDRNVAIVSALLGQIATSDLDDLKGLYRSRAELRPFFQYLAHSVARSSVQTTFRELDELLQASLAVRQGSASEGTTRLRELARAYLAAIAERPSGTVKIADTTGLGTFSFDELLAKVRDDARLSGDLSRITTGDRRDLKSLVDILKWIPEFELGLIGSPGEMNSGAVATVVSGWMSGQRLSELARHFPGEDEHERLSEASQYVHSKLSQQLSWGTHAFLRAWSMVRGQDIDAAPASVRELSSRIQFGVVDGPAIVAALLGVPRDVANAMSQTIFSAPPAEPADMAQAVSTFLQSASPDAWTPALEVSGYATFIAPTEFAGVWRRINGYT